MKALITEVKYLKEFEGKFGTLHGFRISYDGKTAFYNSKSKDQNKFIKGSEAEFNEFEKSGAKGKFIQIKPIFEGGQQRQSNFGKRVAVEQSRYAGFSTSYAKDLVIAGIIPFTEIQEISMMLFNHMVELDKSIEK